MKPKTLKNIISYVTAVVFTFLILLVIAGIWRYSKVWNYNINYKSMVKQTITEIVKEDCLRNPEKK